MVRRSSESLRPRRTINQRPVHGYAFPPDNNGVYSFTTNNFFTRSITIHFNDSISKRLRRLLWQVVPDAAFDHPVRILSRKLLCISTCVRMRCSVRIAFERDRGHVDRGSLRKSPFKIIILTLTFSQAKSPAVVMDHDLN